MVPIAMNRGVSPVSSLRAKMLLAVSGSVFLLIAVVIALGAFRIKHMSLVQIRHEGLLLAHTLDAAIAGHAASGEIAEVQKYIDSLVAVRHRNDLEVNVGFVSGGVIDIVASNIPDNIEEADEDEYEATVAALKTGEPDLLVEVEDGPEDETELLLANDPTHPDFYFPAGSRLLSITTPLVYEGDELGSINIKLSLHYLDAELARLTYTALAAVAIGCLVLLFVLVPLMNRKVFNPLSRLAREMFAFGTGAEISDLAPSLRRDEIGVLENEFYNMVARINSAEAMRQELEKARSERERHEMESRLRQAQKMEALGTLAGGIAHDFNNILTPIIGYSEIIMERLAGDREVQEDLGQVVRAGYRAQDLVKQILAFSRQSNEEKAPLKIGPVIKETLKLLRASIPANVEIRERVPATDAAVEGNPTHIHQIVLNLATNASHAMIETGGRLDVVLSEEVLETERGVEHSQHLPAGRYLRLMVEDTGEGIRPEVVERIFEPYFTTKKEGEGTGLGLAMVHGIVQEMGGAITVESEIGSGTRFNVYLPVVEQTADEACIVREECPRGTESVLIVDDEEPIAQMVGVLLDSLGYQTVVYTDPVPALAAIAADPDGFDLVVSDISMPGMTGVEFAKRLAELGAETPIILSSGYAGGINWRSADAVGIKAMVVKPIVKSKLARSVREVLDALREALPA